jgi:hypothetical protein
MFDVGLAEIYEALGQRGRLPGGFFADVAGASTV